MKSAAGCELLAVALLLGGCDLRAWTPEVLLIHEAAKAPYP